MACLISVPFLFWATYRVVEILVIVGFCLYRKNSFHLSAFLSGYGLCFAVGLCSLKVLFHFGSNILLIHDWWENILLK